MAFSQALGNLRQSAIQRFVALRRRSPQFDFLIRVYVRFNADDGGNRVGYITYYAFLSLLPLLLAALSVFDIVFSHDSSVRTHLISSTVATIPVIGTTLKSDLSFVKQQGLTLVVTIVVLLWASRGGALALQNALWSIFRCDELQRSFLSRQLRAYGALGVIAFGLMIPTAANSLFRHVLLVRLVILLASFAWNGGVLYLMFALLVSAERARGWGVVIGGIVITIVQFLSVVIMSHTLQNARPLYGTLAIVLALLAWIALQVRVVLYAAEINMVQREKR